MTKLKFLCCFFLSFLLSFNALANADNQPPKEWTTWLESLKKEMIAKGISQKTIDEAYKGKNYYHKISAVVQQDKKQTEFVLTTCNYINRLVNEARVKEGRKQYKKLNDKYKKTEEKYD